MALKFKKRIKILPGIYANFGKGGFSSMSIFGYNTKTQKTTVNLPVSGMSYQIDHKKKQQASAGEFTSATIKVDKHTMEGLKAATGTTSNKAAIEAIVNEYIENLNNKYSK